MKALKQLRLDRTQVILTADKGVALVVFDKQIIWTKLLEERETCKTIAIDPTKRCKNRLINLLKKIKKEGAINDTLYKKMYQTGACAAKFYGLPKVCKRDIPLRPIVSSRGTMKYGVAEELGRVLSQLVGNSPIILRIQWIL